MTPADRPLFAEAMHLLGEAFCEPVSAVRAEAYYRALEDLPLAVVNVAAVKALRVCKFFPRPAELRELVEGDVQTQADAGWSALIREVRRVGYLGTPTFEDPRVLQAIVDVWGSWSRLCETLPCEGPEVIGWAKQFKSAYRSVGVRADHNRFLQGLPTGLREAVAQVAQGKAMPEPAGRADVVRLDAVKQLRTLRTGGAA